LLEFVLELCDLALVLFVVAVLALLFAAAVFLDSAFLVVTLGHHHGVLGEFDAGGVDCGEGELKVFVFVHVLVVVVQQKGFFLSDKIWINTEVLLSLD
jgi:hypothetical protein